MAAKPDKLRGVNLGGWLVLEKWMTPSVFKGSKAQDEYSLSMGFGADKQTKINSHRNNFIKEKDFQKIADAGFNAVRLPVGHWIFGGYKPYIKSEKYVDKAMEWAAEFGLKVVIDLHTAPGSQNGQIHSGQAGQVSWHSNPQNIADTINIIGQIAKTYGQHPNLYGIELLNEPARDIPLSILQDYYRRAYKEVRKHCGKSVAVIVSDAYRPQAEWEDFIKSNRFTNMLVDMHLYQLFSDEDKNLSFEGHIQKTFKWKRDLKNFGLEKIIVGEWSVMLDNSYASMNSAEAAKAADFYAKAQLFAFSGTAANFYWNYKTENEDFWNSNFLKKQT